MNAETEKLFLDRRVQTAAKIIASPDEFKVCDQCQSIAFKRAAVCPICHAYRWRESREEVQRIAQVTTRNAFPVTAAVVPRV